VSPVTLGRNSDVGGLEGIGGPGVQIAGTVDVGPVEGGGRKKRAPRERG
jgi:hypothetical protein